MLYVMPSPLSSSPREELAELFQLRSKDAS